MSLYHARLGRGPDLVLLHGWGMNAAVWEPLLPALSERYCLTLIELPGHGASPPAAAADLSAWARSCLAAAPRRAWWIGWSLGGQVAIRAALDTPRRVAGLLLVGATPCFVQRDGWACAMPVKTFRLFADALRGDPQGTLMRFLALQVKGAQHARNTLRRLRAELQQRPPASPIGLTQGLELLLHTDLRAELADLACPSHWLFGSRDTLVPPGVGARIAALAPRATAADIVGAAHAPFLSHPGQSLAVLAGLLKAA